VQIGFLLGRFNPMATACRWSSLLVDFTSWTHLPALEPKGTGPIHFPAWSVPSRGRFGRVFYSYLAWEAGGGQCARSPEFFFVPLRSHPSFFRPASIQCLKIRVNNTIWRQAIQLYFTKFKKKLVKFEKI
jgi:hypothetical protein